MARADLDRLQPWHHLGAFIPVGWRGPVRSRPPVPLGETVDEDALALPAVGDALAATLARGKNAIHGAIPPMDHPFVLCDPQKARWHGRQRAIRLPALQPAMRRTLRGPLESTRDITLPASGHQDLPQRVQYVPKRHMRHATTALGRCWGKDSCKQAPFSITHACKAACHNCPPLSR